jgi:hypothetical protein
MTEYWLLFVKNLCGAIMAIITFGFVLVALVGLANTYPVGTLVGFFVFVLILVVALMTEEDLKYGTRRYKKAPQKSVD